MVEQSFEVEGEKVTLRATEPPASPFHLQSATVTAAPKAAQTVPRV